MRIYAFLGVGGDLGWDWDLPGSEAQSAEVPGCGVKPHSTWASSPQAPVCLCDGSSPSDTGRLRQCVAQQVRTLWLYSEGRWFKSLGQQSDVSGGSLSETLNPYWVTLISQS